MTINTERTLRRRIAVAGLLTLAGCAVRPAGEDEERRRAAEAGRAWTEHVEVPPLPESPAPEDYLRHAFLANADLQARYWEWRAAIEQIPQDASFPNVALPFSVMFNDENMKAWDRTTLGLTNDPMANIPFPSKLAAAGRRALETARAAGFRFEAAKFALQREVLDASYDLALAAESARLQEERVALARATAGAAAERVRTGAAAPAELAAAQNGLALALNEQANLGLEVHHAGVRLNRAIGRSADARVPSPASLPPPRPLPAPDAELIRLGSERSPALAALAREVAGREEALDLARKAWIPDFGLSLSVTGTVSRTVGGMLVLPTRVEAIKAGIAQAEANLNAARAARTQYERELAAAFVLNLYVLRNAERQVELFDGTLVPASRRIADLSRSAYATNRGGFAEALESARAAVDARRTLAALRIEREKALAAIETWSAVDVEVMRPGGMGTGSAPAGAGAGGRRPVRGAVRPGEGASGGGGMGTMR